MGYVGKVTDTDGTTGLVGSTLYGTCSTAADTVAKVGTCSDFDTLIDGVTIHIKFTNSNTATNPTLNVNSTGAKRIYKNGTTSVGTTVATSWAAGSVVSLTYDGSAWQMNDHTDNTNTTYSAGSGLSLSGQTFNHSNSVTAGTAKGDDSKTLTFGGTFTIPTVTYDAQGHITGKGTTTMTMPANPDTDTKVTQSSSTTSDFRPLLLGKNNQTNPENLETTVTDQTYVTKHVFVQPSTGNLTLYNASGDSPSLIFRRGTMIDSTLEWRIQNVGGKLNFDRDKNESTETWENILQLDPTNSKMYFKNTEVSLSGHTHNYAGSSSAGGAANSANVLNYNNSVTATTSGLQYTHGSMTIGTADGNAKEGSNASYKLWSYPTGGTTTSSTSANIQNLRLYWSSTYFRDIFISPNNQDIYHRAVYNGSAKPWRVILDSFNLEQYNIHNDTVSKTFDLASGNTMGPIERSIDLFNRANKLALIESNKISIEYSTDSGSNWTAYGLTADQNADLFNGSTFRAIYIGPNSTAERTTSMQTRITITNDNRDVIVDQIFLMGSTSYHTVSVDIQVAYGNATSTFSNWKTGIEVGPWKYQTMINLETKRFGAGTTASYVNKIRFILKYTQIDSNHKTDKSAVKGISGFGGCYWTGTVPNYLALNNHLYSWDNSKNATFPANIVATGFKGTVYHNATNPTSESNYPVSFGASSSDFTSRYSNIGVNDGISYRTAEGTTSANGFGILCLGNSIASGTAGNKYGGIRLYSSAGTYYTQITPTTLTATRQLSLPNKGGTIAVTSDIPTVSGVYLPLAGGTMTGDIEYPGPGGRKTIFGKSAFMYYVASTSNWAGGLNYYSSDGSTRLGAFGAYGTANTLSYHYIGGTYDAPQIKIDPTASDTSGGPNLIINSEDASTPMITFFRKGDNKADWRIKNQSGNLKIQSDYTTTVGAWYDVLNMEYSTGNIVMKTDATFTFGKFASESANANRYVFFKEDNANRICVNDSFKYNPSTNVLTVGSITGSATKLGTANKGSTTKGIYLDAGVPKEMTYTLGSTVNAGTANQLAYYSGANAISATHDGTNTNDSLYFKTGTNAKSARQIILGIYGQTYGNDASTLISGTAGVLSYGDGGPQIDFNTSSSGSQAGALIFTDKDTAGTGASWHFVSNQSDWNVTSKRFHARTSISIGTDKPTTSYNLYVNGTTYITGATTITNSSFAPFKIIRSGSANASAIAFANSNGTLGYIGMTASANGGLYRWNTDTNIAYRILDDAISPACKAIAQRCVYFGKSDESDPAGWKRILTVPINGTSGKGINDIKLFVRRHYNNNTPESFSVHIINNYTDTPAIHVLHAMQSSKLCTKIRITKSSDGKFNHVEIYYNATKRNTITIQYNVIMPYELSNTAYNSTVYPADLTEIPNISDTVTAQTTIDIPTNIAQGNLKNANGFWGMALPDGTDTDWIRTTSNGIIPYQSGGAGSGHGKLGTSSWYFSEAYIDTVHGSLSGNATNVTGTVAIANGGTGATTRLGALKALTNEGVGTNAQYFLTITQDWGKGGYTSVANVKTVLGLKSAAYTESSDYVPITGGNVSGSIYYKSTKYDGSAANNGVSSGIEYPTTFNILDKSSRILVRLEGMINSTGAIGSYWYIRNYNTSGTQVAQKGISMSMAKDGTLTYTVSDGANFRSAIGAGTSSLTIGTTATTAAAGNHTHNYAGSSSAGGAATSANKINTDAGSATLPVYFSGGIPVVTTAPKSGAWFSSFTGAIGSSGVMEVGRYIDFHSTNAGTTDYDVRIDASSTSLLTITSNSGTPQLRLSGTLPRLRFTQTTSGKAYDNALCGISAYPGNTAGVNLTIQSGGNTFIGGGESPVSLYSRIITTNSNPYGTSSLEASEQMFITADTNIYFVSGAGSISATAYTDWTDLKTALFDSNGYFRPSITDKGSIGTSSYKWKSVYATTFYGNLDGDVYDSNIVHKNSVSIKKCGQNEIYRSMINLIKPNKLAFFPTSNITIEYSTNGGSSWTDMGLSNEQKAKLFIMKNEGNVPVGPNTTAARTTSMQTRIVIEFSGGHTNVGYFDQVAIALGGTSDNVVCDIFSYDHTLGTDTLASNVPISRAVAGMTMINTLRTHGASTCQTLTLVFKYTAVSSNVTGIISDIQLFGESLSVAEDNNDQLSNMTKYNHLYSWDYNQNATFPAKITATSFTGNVTGNCSGSSGSCTGNAATATKVTISRVTKDSKVFPGANKVVFEEYTNGTTYNLPSNHFYHIMSAQGSDTKYGTQLALGMTTTAAYYRSYNNQTWSAWKSIINTDTYDRNRYNANIKAGSSALVAANIIVGKDGVYKHLKSGGAFDITYPILYLNGAVDANGTTTNTYDTINFTVTTTQSLSLTAYKPVYIKGTLNGTVFTPVNTTPLIQTIPTSGTTYDYIYLGQATSSTTVYLQERHPIYSYRNGRVQEITPCASMAVTSDGFVAPMIKKLYDNSTTSTNYITISDVNIDDYEFFIICVTDAPKTDWVSAATQWIPAREGNHHFMINNGAAPNQGGGYIHCTDGSVFISKTGTNNKDLQFTLCRPAEAISTIGSSVTTDNFPNTRIMRVYGVKAF